MDWYIKELEPKDRERFLRLLARRITYVPISDHYKWLYRENPHGTALTWLAMDQKSHDVIGGTSIFPRKVWVRDRIVLGSIGGDAFVDPKFRRRGIAKELHRVSLMGMREAGIEFHYGFPTSPNLGALVKAGAYHSGSFRKIRFGVGERILNRLCQTDETSVPLAKIAKKILSLYTRHKLTRFSDTRCNLKEVSRFGYEFDELTQNVGRSFNICVVRDTDYLNWRYFRNPLRPQTVLNYEMDGDLCGFAALEFSKARCYIVDFLVKREAGLAEKFICALTELAISKGSNIILSMVNPFGPYNKSFLRCGFKFGSDPSDEIPFQVLSTNEKGDVEYIRRIENWYLTYMDVDIESIAHLS